MAHIKLTSTLKRFFPDLGPSNIEGNSILDILEQLNLKYPGIINYVLDDQMMLRKHVNLFIDGEILKDREDLSQSVEDATEIYIFQALSGG